MRLNKARSKKPKLYEFHRGFVFGTNFLKKNSDTVPNFRKAVAELDNYSDSAQTFGMYTNFDKGMDSASYNYSGESYA